MKKANTHNKYLQSKTDTCNFCLSELKRIIILDKTVLKKYASIKESQTP